MNPLSELREQLVYLAGAGTQLLSEDFRLKKAAQSFELLAEKNPVFQKINTDLNALLSAPQEEQGTLLLNLLGLMDAVLYTQALYEVEGVFQPLPSEEIAGTFVPIQYSQIIPIFEAFSKTEDGHWSPVWTALHQNPQYFGDYRIISAMIENLGNPYSDKAKELLNMLHVLVSGQPLLCSHFNWQFDGNCHKEVYHLPKVDQKKMIAQLKSGFDPTGKADMTRRILLISLIAGASENDWYLSLLDTAKKDVRAVAVFSLGYKEENIPLLLELVKKEHGRAKEMAYRALAQWDRPQVLELWEKTLKKKPHYAQYLSTTTLDSYGDLAAAHLKEMLGEVLGKKQIERAQMDEIDPWVDALGNKASRGIIELYDWIMEHHLELPDIREMCGHYENITQILPKFQEQICTTLILHQPKRLIDYLQQIDIEEDKIWLEGCLLADLLTLPAAELYEKWKEETDPLIYRQMQQIRYGDGTYYCTIYVSDVSLFSLFDYESVQCEIRERLDPRWVDVLIKNKWECMFGIIDFNLSEEWRTKIGTYLYDSCAEIEENCVQFHISTLKRKMNWMYLHGWKNYDDLLVNLCKSYPDIRKYQLCAVFKHYKSLAGETETQQEAKRVLQYLRNHPNPETPADDVWRLLIERGFLTEDA